ncbi:glycosyltransferase [Paenibacillus sp. JJ1722]|uniref:glycosyltransferase n=1 Tax=Paenibacillus sp. JJ1722 TaxID=3398770 RepID=UPI003AAF4231
MSKTIALCMIVKNEEQFLRRCLDSVKNKVNQIIIVDTGSTDNTLSIAKEYTNDVYSFKWVDDFSAARNESIKYATTDYILVMDADEYLEEDSNLQDDISTGKDWYFLKIHNILSQGRKITHIAVRLFANNKGLFFQNRLHEHLNILVEDKVFTNDFGNSALQHTGYTDDMMEDRDKKKRNLPLMLREVQENPNAYNLFNMGRTYKWVEEYEKAIHYFQNAYPLSKNLTIMPDLLMNLTNCLVSLKREQEALKIINDAAILFPNETDLRHTQALLFLELGYLRDAAKTFETCLSLGDQGITITEGNGGYMSHFRLAEVYEKSYRISESYEHIIDAVRDSKSFAVGISKYFQIVTMANIPLEDVYQNFSQIYKMSKVEELQLLIEILYIMRHPILNRYLSEYEIKVEEKISAVATQYDKQYEKAKLLWTKMVEITRENGEDILLLAFILKDLELFELSLSYLNLSMRETKMLRSIILNEELRNLKFSSYIENILAKIIENLLVLQEYEVFQCVLNYAELGSINFNCSVIEKIIKYGFYEVAIDLLIKLFKTNANNIKVIQLLGDMCYKLNYLEDAQLFYSKLLELCPEYSSYERCYMLFEKLDDKENQYILKESIKKSFPLCLWVLE